MQFLVPGNSIGRELDEEEEYGLQTPPGIPVVSPVKPSSITANDPLPPLTEEQEVALYKQVLRDEELEKKSFHEKAKQEEEEEEKEEPEPDLWHPKKPPPAGLYQASILSFFFSIELLIRWSCLAVLIFIVIFIIDKSLALISVRAAGIATFGAWFGGMMFLALGGMLGIGCFIYAAALAMSILLDTSNGQKRIESWPKGFFFDWLLQSGYVAGAIFWSMLPGVPLGWLAEGSRISPIFAFSATVAIFFPPALLAELDVGTFYFPGAPDVWLSPFRALRAWLDFYLITIPLVALAAGMTAYAFANDNFLLLVLSSIFASAVWLLYFRLLGRLAWYASAKSELSR
jgi:hypothetical protein